MNEDDELVVIGGVILVACSGFMFWVIYSLVLSLL